MGKISKQEKDRIKSLFDEGLSKHKIAKLLNLSRSSVIRYSGEKGAYNRPVKFFPIGYSKVDGEVVGIFTGDGSQYYEPRWGSYEITIHVGRNNPKYVEYVKNLYETHFNKKFWICQDKVCFKLRTKSKAMFRYFSNYLVYDPKLKHCTVRLIKTDLPNSFKIGFLRGLCDTDGTVSRKENRTRIAFYTTSYALANQLCTILSEMDIENSIYSNVREHRNEKELYSVIILKSSVDKFINIVKPLKARIG